MNINSIISELQNINSQDDFRIRNIQLLKFTNEIRKMLNLDEYTVIGIKLGNLSPVYSFKSHIKINSKQLNFYNGVLTSVSNKKGYNSAICLFNGAEFKISEYPFRVNIVRHPMGTSFGLS